jgi:hypothetical protein
MVEAVWTYETLAKLYQSTYRYNPDNNVLIQTVLLLHSQQIKMLILRTTTLLLESWQHWHM